MAKKEKKVIEKWAHQWEDCAKAIDRGGRHYYDIILFDTEQQARNYRPDLKAKEIRITVEEL